METVSTRQTKGKSSLKVQTGYIHKTHIKVQFVR